MKRIPIIVLLLLYTVLTHERVKVWKNDFSVWSDAAAKAPCLSRPHAQLAEYYKRVGDPERALFHWGEAVKRALVPCGTPLIQ